jgi:hypothetical protein
LDREAAAAAAGVVVLGTEEEDRGGARLASVSILDSDSSPLVYTVVSVVVLWEDPLFQARAVMSRVRSFLAAGCDWPLVARVLFFFRFRVRTLVF